MRIASWHWGGRDHVGTISSCGREVTPLAVPDAARGALPLIQRLASGEPLPPPSGMRLPADVVTLRAPLPSIVTSAPPTSPMSATESELSNLPAPGKVAAISDSLREVSNGN